MDKNRGEGTLASVDISTGNPSGAINVGDIFEFSTNTASNNISVTAPINSPWFSPSPADLAGPGKVTVKAMMESVGLGWGYSVEGMQVQNSNPHITVGGAMSAHAKAS